MPRSALPCRGCGIALTAVLVGLVATVALGRADAWAYTVPGGDRLRTLTERHLELIGYASRLQAADGVGNPYLLPPGEQAQVPSDWARRRLGIARIVDQGGGCTLTRIGAKAPAALRVGVELARGDAVSCGAHSYATLEFEDGSQLRVQPDSKIHLDATRRGGFFEQDAAPRRGRTQISVPVRAPSSRRFHSPAPPGLADVTRLGAAPSPRVPRLLRA